MRPYWRRACSVASLLLVLAPAADATATPMTVAVDFSQVAGKTFHRIKGLALENRALVRLVQEGFAVVGHPNQPQIRIRLLERGANLVLEGRAGDLVRTTRLTSGAPIPALHLEAAQKIVELARGLRAAVLRRQSKPEPPMLKTKPEPPRVQPKPEPPRVQPKPEPPLVQPKPEPPVVKPKPEPPVVKPKPEPPVAKPKPDPPVIKPKPIPPVVKPKRRSPVAATRPTPTAGWRVRAEVGSDLAALVRPGGSDALVGLGLRIGIGPALGLHLRAGLAPASNPAAGIQEWQIQVGAGLRFDLGRNLDLELGLLVGVLVHRFDLGSAAPTESTGDRTDLLTSLPLILGWRLWKGLTLTVRLAIGLADASRSHVLGGTTLWERGRFRLESGLGFAWRFQ